MNPFPENYYKAEHVGGFGNDKNFITEQLEQISFKQREMACTAYSGIFSSDGRSDANTRLRAFVKKCVSKNNGCTIKPNLVK